MRPMMVLLLGVLALLAPAAAASATWKQGEKMDSRIGTGHRGQLQSADATGHGAVTVVAEAGTPSGQNGIKRRTLEASPDVHYYYYVPQLLAAKAPLLVTVHGISRNALEHIESFVAEADMRGIVLVAPMFDEKNFPDYQRLGRAGRGSRADLALQAILAQVTEETGLASDKVYLFGHSGGAQFVHRYVMAYPERVAGYGISAAGWYTLPDFSMKFPRGMGETADLPDVRFSSERFFAIPACIMVGERDTERDESLRKSDFVDSYEGENRVERAESWLAAMRAAVRWRGLHTPLHYEELPAAGHDFTSMVRKGRLSRRLFRCLFDSGF